MNLLYMPSCRMACSDQRTMAKIQTCLLEKHHSCSVQHKHAKYMKGGVEIKHYIKLTKRWRDLKPKSTCCLPNCKRYRRKKVLKLLIIPTNNVVEYLIVIIVIKMFISFSLSHHTDKHVCMCTLALCIYFTFLW